MLAGPPAQWGRARPLTATGGRTRGEGERTENGEGAVVGIGVGIERQQGVAAGIGGVKPVPKQLQGIRVAVAPFTVGVVGQFEGGQVAAGLERAGAEGGAD